MKSTFRILFLARWELKKENDKVPLCARITIDGERVKFSLKSEVTAKFGIRSPGGQKGRPKKRFNSTATLTVSKGK